MKKLILSGVLSLIAIACGQKIASEGSQVKSHPLDEFVNETTELSPEKNIAVAPSELKKVSLGNLGAQPYSVLVYVTADMVLKGADLAGVTITLIEPPYYGGEVFYTHEIFTPMPEFSYGPVVELNNELLKGNNPLDETVDGEWFVEISNKGNAVVTLESLTLKVRTRLD